MTVSVLIGIILWDGCAPDSPTAALRQSKVGMIDVDSGIHNVSPNSLSSVLIKSVIVSFGSIWVSAMSNSRKSPWSIVLEFLRAEDAVGLNVRNLEELLEMANLKWKFDPTRKS